MIRKAELKDTDKICELLYQVHDVHAKGRPDIFIKGKKKFSDDEVREIIRGKGLTFFVYEKDDEVLGYACVQIQETEASASRHGRRELYIEDICVDEKHRREGVASMLFDYVVKLAKKKECNCVTLNVWELNEDARKFYEAKGMFPLKTIMEKIL